MMQMCTLQLLHCTYRYDESYAYIFTPVVIWLSLSVCFCDGRTDLLCIYYAPFVATRILRLAYGSDCLAGKLSLLLPQAFVCT